MLVRVGALAATLACLTIALAFPPGADAAALRGLEPDGCYEDFSAPGTDCPEASGLNGARGVAVRPTGNAVYVASQVDDAIVRFNRDPDGTLTHMGCVGNAVASGCTSTLAGLDGARDVAISPDGASAYVAAFDSDTVVRFNLLADGTLSGGTAVPAGNGPMGVTVSADGASVYVVTENDESIRRYNRAGDGSLTFVDCWESGSALAGCGAGRQLGSDLIDPTDVTVSPDGASVYVTDVTRGVIRFNRAVGGAITPAATGITGALGLDGATGIAVTPDGASAYVSSGIDIFGFHRATSGSLTFTYCREDPASVNNFCPDEQNGLSAEGVAVSPDDASVLFASSADETIHNYSRSPDGSLSLNECFSDLSLANCPLQTGGLDGATGVAVSPNGASAYAASVAGDAVVHFKRGVAPICRTNSSSGAPGAAQTVALDCFDNNGDATTILIDKGPANGTLGAVNQGAKTVAYTPTGGFAGTDSFDIRALAGGSLSNVATVVVGVQTATGPQGPQGQQGPQGPQGPPGRDANVTCKAKGKKIKCTVAFAAASGVRRAMLSRNGVTYADGKPTARGDQLVLRFGSSRRLASGRYVLTVIQHASGNRVVTKSTVQIR